MSHSSSVKNLSSISSKCLVMASILKHEVEAPSTMHFCMRRCLELLTAEVVKHAPDQWGSSIKSGQWLKEE